MAKNLPSPLKPPLSHQTRSFLHRGYCSPRHSSRPKTTTSDCCRCCCLQILAAKVEGNAKVFPRHAILQPRNGWVLVHPFTISNFSDKIKNIFTTSVHLAHFMRGSTSASISTIHIIIHIKYLHSILIVLSIVLSSSRLSSQ